MFSFLKRIFERLNIFFFYIETKVWEHDALYGHGHNVSSAVFCSPLVLIKKIHVFKNFIFRI